jgi:hypothetical protein
MIKKNEPTPVEVLVAIRDDKETKLSKDNWKLLDLCIRSQDDD